MSKQPTKQTEPVNVGFGVEYARAMVELRRSSAASRHKDRKAEARKGYGKGGRSGARTAWSKDT